MQIKWTDNSNYIKGTTLDIDLTNSKMAAFDLDHTLVKPTEGKKYSETDSDWELYDKSIPQKLAKLDKDGYHLVIISNQKGMSKGKVDPNVWKSKLLKLVNLIGLDFTIFCSLKDDLYRKPRTKLWELINGDKKTSFYCGDAGGLPKRKIKNVVVEKDFSDSDLKFALNVGIKFLHRDEFIYDEKYTKETYNIQYIDFSKFKKEQYVFKANRQEVIINVGLPASGKSRYSLNQIIKNNTDYVYINQDTLKTPKKCCVVLIDALNNGKSAVIDNTNMSKANRKQYIDIANSYGVKCRCLVFTTSKDICIHNSYYRNFNTNGAIDVIPTMVYNMMNKKYEKPELSEGFYEINEIDFVVGDQTPDCYKHYFT